jgi:uncharacterized protein (TIGR00255 family)
MRSMTGYGAASGKAGSISLTVEVRSVNQRHLDVKIVAPREYGEWESELRREVGETISRGRVDVFIQRSPAASAKAIGVNEKLVAAYVSAWREIKRQFKLEGEVELSLLQGRAEIFQPIGADADPAREIGVAKKALARALAAHDRERRREGEHLARDIVAQLKVLRSVLSRVRTKADGLAPRLRARLEEKLAALLDSRAIDPARLAQETAVLADRADVGEEVVRLASHLDALGKLIEDRDPVGKRIEFLVQEINRELNTIGSKASDLEVTNFVIEGKAAVEKVREQAQNVE